MEKTKNRESDSWRVVAHDEIPFVLVKNREVAKAVFEFLRLLHLKGMSARTIRAYAYDLLAFHRFVEDQVISPEEFEVVSFILFLRKQNASPRTINRRLTVVRSFLNHVEGGWGDRVFGPDQPSFYKGVRNKALLGPSRIRGRRKSLKVKVPGILITPMTSIEIKKFLLGLRKYRDIAILYLMIFCGLRSCEVLSLETGDINVIDDQIHIRGKGQKERVLPLSQPVRKALMDYLDYERPEVSHSRCFVVLKGPHRGQPMTSEGLRKLFRSQRRKSVRRAHAHLFRHTFATSLIREHVSLPVVQKLMGHSDIEVTMGYVHMSSEDVSREYHQAVTSLQKSCETA
jgi:site-specific recombinase XerD